MSVWKSEDLVLEFFYDSALDEKWHVTVSVDGEEQFQLSGNTWEGIIEDLRWKVPMELSEVMSPVGW